MNITKVIPVMVYADIPRAHDFLIEVFGFEAGGVQRDSTGRAVHAGGSPLRSEHDDSRTDGA